MRNITEYTYLKIPVKFSRVKYKKKCDLHWTIFHLSSCTYSCGGEKERERTPGRAMERAALMSLVSRLAACSVSSPSSSS